MQGWTDLAIASCAIIYIAFNASQILLLLEKRSSLHVSSKYSVLIRLVRLSHVYQEGLVFRYHRIGVTYVGCQDIGTVSG